MSDVLGGGDTTVIRSFDMSEIVSAGVDLTEFRDSDYSYDARTDVIFVRVGSPLFTWISLKL
jgi:hypothetical protein